jgi:hypothetical protein
MIKLKDLLTEWTDTSFKDLPKRWSKPVMKGREPDGLTEFERLGGKDIIKEEAVERSTKEFIKTLRRVKSSLGVFERALDLYREPNRSIGDDYWWVHKTAMNSLEAGVKKLSKIYWKRSKDYQKKYKR